MASPSNPEILLPQSFSFETCSTVPHHHVDQKLALIMVGLPARGKTYTARRLGRYLSWLGFPVRVFNVSNYRRKHIGTKQAHTFFDESNAEASAKRWKVAMSALDDLIKYYADGGLVSIYDATNVTREKRARIKSLLEKENIKVMFVESICETPEIIEAHMQASKSLPDYVQMDPNIAQSDFLLRIEHYRKVYQMLTKEEGVSFIQIIDSGEQVVMHRVGGYLEARVAHFIINLRIEPREIYRPYYVTRHGQSIFNLGGRIGGDSGLYETGQLFSHRLAEFMVQQQQQQQHSSDTAERSFDSKGWQPGELQVWTSSLIRTIQTAAPLQSVGACGAIRQWRSLDEIDAGICDGMTYEEIEEKMPEEFAARAKDKLRYRYPNGESYIDVIHRVEPVILELERTSTPTLIIGHQAVLRTLLAYFLEGSQSDIPFIEVPLHTVMKIIPSAVGCRHKSYKLL